MPSDVMKMNCSAGTHVNNYGIMYIGKQLTEYVYPCPYISLYIYVCIYQCVVV